MGDAAVEAVEEEYGFGNGGGEDGETVETATTRAENGDGG